MSLNKNISSHDGTEYTTLFIAVGTHFLNDLNFLEIKIKGRIVLDKKDRLKKEGWALQNSIETVALS
jgi:hypothetical protein